GIDAQRVVLGRVEFDDGATAHAEQMVDRHGGGAKLDRDFDFNIVQCAHTYMPMRITKPRGGIDSLRIDLVRSGYGRINSVAGSVPNSFKIASHRRAAG